MRKFTVCRYYGRDVDTGEYKIIGPPVAVNLGNIKFAYIDRLPSDKKEQQRYVVTVVVKGADRIILGDLYKTEAEAVDTLWDFATENYKWQHFKKAMRF